MRGVGEGARARRARDGVLECIVLGGLAGARMARRLDPGADAAVLPLDGEEMPKPPLRLVEDVGDAVRVLGDRELSVAEVSGAH